MSGLLLHLFRSSLSPKGTSPLNVFDDYDKITLVKVVPTTSVHTEVPDWFVMPEITPDFPLEPSTDRPAAELVIRFMRYTMPGSIHVLRASHYIRPLGTEHRNTMAGGTFAYTSDSRFSRLTGIYGAIAVHDRIE